MDWLPGMMGTLVVRTKRRADAPGHPVQRHRGEQLVFSEAPFDFSTAITPGAPFLDYPRAQSRRGVGEAIRGRLRLRALDRRIASFLGKEVLGLGKPPLLLLAVLCGQRQLTREGDREIKMHPDEPLGVNMSQIRADQRADVAPLS